MLPIILLMLIPLTSLGAALQPAITSTITIDQIDDFNSYPVSVQKLIKESLLLTTQHLTYRYASSDPKNGGMDCSGTIHYVLKDLSPNVPTGSNDIYEWVKKEGKFIPYNANTSFEDLIKQIQPGDLLFWTGTYTTLKDIGGVTHVMIYLGTSHHHPIMFGASDGRTYKNKKMWGVSIFDFYLPSPISKSKFIGYSCIPHYTC